MPRVVVAGCGFVGLATARLLHARGCDVLALTHSRESAAELAGEPFTAAACDITDRAALERLDAGEVQAVIHCASSGRGGADEYRRVYLEGARNLLDALEPERLLFTSSTSVYAQTTGEWVTEESPADPARETGRILRETEELVLAASGAVARLAGIYGPGRSVLLRKFFDGTATIEGDGARWINQAHRDDIAAALATILDRASCGIFNVCDDEPLQQRALYAWLAERFALPLPPTGPPDTQRKRGVTNKRVSNAKLRALGWAPRFGVFREAVEADAAVLAPQNNPAPA